MSILLSMSILQVVMLFLRRPTILVAPFSIQAMLHAIEAANASMLTDLKTAIFVPMLIPLAMSISPFTTILQLMLTVMSMMIPQVMAIPFQHVPSIAESIIQPMMTHTHRSTIVVVLFFTTSMPLRNELVHKFTPRV